MQSTSSVSEDKEDFGRKSITMRTAVAQLNIHQTSLSQMARKHSVSLARHKSEPQATTGNRKLIEALSANPTINSDAIELRSELANHLYNSPLGFREMVEASQAPTNEIDLLAQWLQDNLARLLDQGTTANKTKNAMHRMINADGTEASNKLAELMNRPVSQQSSDREVAPSVQLKQALEAANKTDILLATMQYFVQPRTINPETSSRLITNSLFALSFICETTQLALKNIHAQKQSLAQAA